MAFIFTFCKYTIVYFTSLLQDFTRNFWGKVDINKLYLRTNSINSTWIWMSNIWAYKYSFFNTVVMSLWWICACADAVAHLRGILQDAQAESSSLNLHLHRGSAGHSGPGCLVSAEHFFFTLKIQQTTVRSSRVITKWNCCTKIKINPAPNV